LLFDYHGYRNAEDAEKQNPFPCSADFTQIRCHIYTIKGWALLISALADGAVFHRRLLSVDEKEIFLSVLSVE
jgi:hypothetical protein